MEQAQGNEDAPVVSNRAFSARWFFSLFLSAVYPTLGASFDGINFNKNATNTGLFQIPPDPCGTAGPNHVVSVVNSTIQWFLKDGTLQHNQSLRNFFNIFAPATATFDPKVIYDVHQGRFVVVTLERVGTVNNQASNRSRIYVAVSDDSDPNGDQRPEVPRRSNSAPGGQLRQERAGSRGEEVERGGNEVERPQDPEEPQWPARPER
jgi:hypothetical protein